ncbi:MAG: fasciclin domain-containing protein, partial [Bacteroidota bacterium]
LGQDLSKTSVTSISEEQLYLSVEGDVIINARSAVSNADNETTNGIVHVISFPILEFPEDNIPTIISDLAAADSLFTTLQAALAATGLDQVLDDTLYTLLAPTDEAFANLGLDASNIVGSFSNEELTEILSFHVLKGRNFTHDLSDDRIYTILGDSTVAQGFDFDVSSSSVSVEIAVETTSDDDVVNVLTTNGTIHVMDEVLFPELYLSEAVGDTRYNVNAGLIAGFAASLTGGALNVDSLLGTEVEYTIFAPRGWVEPGSNEEIRRELLGHIFEDAFNIEDQIGEVITSLNGGRFFVTNAQDNFALNGVNTVTRFTSGASVIEDG